MTTHKPTAVIYVRLSSLREDSTSVSPTEQEEACRNLAAAKGWEVVEVISDLDVSGSAKGLRLDRPGLLRVREMLPSVDFVLARSIDRIARSVVDFAVLAEEAEKHGTALATVKESLDLSTPSGVFVATILAAFAQMEAETIAARVRDGRAGLRRAGRWGGGHTPFGYRSAPVDPDDKSKGRTLVPDADEAQTIRRAADLILDGITIWRVCQTLDEEGHRPRAAAAWHYTSLRNALTSDAVLGRLRHDGKAVRDEHGDPVVAFEPILPREDFERLRAILLDGNRKTRSGTPKAPGASVRAAQLLSGIAYCDTCGKRLYASWGTRKIKGENVRVEKYACSNNECPAKVTIAEHLIEPYVEEEFLARFGAFTHVVAVERSQDIGALADAEEALRETTEAMTAPGADLVALSARVGELVAVRDALAAESTEVVTEFVDSGMTMREVWETGDVDLRRDLLANVIDDLRVAPGQRGRKGRDDDRVRITWRGETP